MGEKEMTLESEKIRAIPMVHSCQWRPFLSPLTPVESICEYWTTLVQATCKSCYVLVCILDMCALHVLIPVKMLMQMDTKKLTYIYIF